MSALIYRLGFALRETGQALERVGCTLQGINSFQEQLTRLNNITVVNFKKPSIADGAFIAPTAALSGDVTVGAGSSVWYNAVVRGDLAPVKIGDNSNLQDGVTAGVLLEEGPATVIGDNVSVGHGATLKGCTVGDHVLVGMGAVLEPGSTVESGSIIAAGAVVAADSVVPSGEVWGGSPARCLRTLKPEEQQYLKSLPIAYTQLGKDHQSILDLVEIYMEKKADS